MPNRHSEEEFAHFYHTYIEGEVKKVEKIRQKGVKKLNTPSQLALRVTIQYFVFVYPILLLTLGLEIFFHAMLLGAIIYVIALANLHQLEKRKLLIKIKDQLVNQVIRFLEPDLQYEAQRSISNELFIESNLYPKEKIDLYQGEDYIHGTIDQTSIAFSEVHAQKISINSRGEDITIFKGLFFVIDFHKKFEGVVYATRKTRHQPNNHQEHLERATLENPAFDDRYYVRTSNQILARYLLTPAFMEKLIEYEESTGSNLTFSFRNGILYLAVETKKNYFDFDLFEPLNQTVIYEALYEVKQALDIIQALRLNTNIWKKH